MTPAKLDDVAALSFLTIQDERGILSVYQGGASVPFAVDRVFSVVASAGTERGGHAHRRCKQLLVCLSGVCAVTCDDGVGRRSFRLDRPGEGLYVPPTIWAEQRYLSEGNVMIVLCDLPYDEGDYIRSYGEFLQFRSLSD